MDLMDIATQLFINKIGAKAPQKKESLTTTIVKMAFEKLLGGDDGKLDLGDLVSKFQTGDLIEVASSWLGNGDNTSISPGQVIDILGADQIGEFASKLGLDTDTASDGLAETIPELIDKSSDDGNLLDAVGGAGGLMDLASKFF